MTNDKRQSTNHDWCPPATENPADQPKPPGNGDDCAFPPPKDPPKLPDPDNCPDPDPSCKCPTKKTPTPICLDKLIATQTATIASAEKAKAFKTDLEKFLTSAKAASQDYTRDKYDKLVKQWREKDRDIAELIRKLVCAVPCWKCIVDCYVCPLIDDLHNLEKSLNGEETLYTTIDNLYDLQYWRTRDKIIKENRFNRIKAVIGAWEKPASAIEKILNDNQALIDAANKALGTAPGTVVYDVFLRLVPMHLAVAPPRQGDDDDWKTRIDAKYAALCGCDTGKPDACCGPDVGVLTLRQRLIGGPQPYLIDPDSYYKLICCLVEKRFGPAKEALTKAEIDAAAADAQIAAAKAQIESSLKSLEKDAKASIPSVVDCCKYEKDEEEVPSSSRAR